MLLVEETTQLMQSLNAVESIRFIVIVSVYVEVAGT